MANSCDVRNGNRLFAIGDIHGCSIALKALIDAIAPRPDDTIVILGDVIDFGPDSRGAVHQLIDLSERCRLILVEGNHEEMMFRAVKTPQIGIPGSTAVAKTR
jgi:serine/threonine protein phosphatase 1